MICTAIGPYEVRSKLGEGGMGEVYRAFDPRLGREVAIKILPVGRSGDPDAVARIVREARLAASIDHPAIVTIHDTGQDTGRFYFVTELVEGETLRERLRRGPLGAPEAIEHATTLASALAAAHARGVVHRDLKPENIMVTASGAIKVLDFGVAAYVTPPDAPTAAAHTALTESGAVIGTPAYMAPEQLEGGTIDHRADQFAFGIVVFEMLAGRRPFTGVVTAAQTASTLRDEPPHLTDVRPDVPAPLARIVARCLQKHPEQRYLSTRELADAVGDVQATLPLLTPSIAMAPRGESWRWGAALAAVVAAVALALWSTTGRRETDSAMASATRAVAVLPFTTIAGAEAYLADGVTEAITRELGHIKGARVIASNTAFAYRDRNERGAEVGRELGADLILRGSVQRAGERVRISAVLIATVDGSTLWSHHYDRVPAADILAVQDDIAWQVAVKLANAIGAPPPPRPPDAPKTTPEAYDAFLRGLSFSREGPRGFPKAIEAFERAVGLDANFALGRARLATAYTQQFFYNAADPALERQAFVEIEKALALNPDLAEAHLARAQLVWNLRNGFPHERAIADLRRALASNLNLSEAHVELGKLYFHIGLTAKAIAANEEALRLDPRAAGATERRLLAMIDGGLTEQVRSELARNPQWSPRARATALSFLERTEDAIGEILPGGHGAGALKKLDMTESALLAQLLARSGRADDARRTLAVAIPLAANPTGLSDTHHAQFAIGCAHALLGDRERAVEWVTRAANEGYPSFPRFSREPDLASIRDHPGFVALMIRLKSDYDRWRDLP